MAINLGGIDYQRGGSLGWQALLGGQWTDLNPNSTDYNALDRADPRSADQTSADWATLSGINDGQDGAFKGEFIQHLQGMLPAGVTNAQISAAIQNRPWYERLGSGSNPYAAAYEVANALGSQASYDQAKSDSIQAQAVRRSPEGQARSNSQGGIFGGGSGDIMKLAALAAAVYTGGASLGAWGAGAAGAGAAGAGAAGAGLTAAEIAAISAADYAGISGANALGAGFAGAGAAGAGGYYAGLEGLYSGGQTAAELGQIGSAVGGGGGGYSTLSDVYAPTSNALSVSDGGNMFDGANDWMNEAVTPFNNNASGANGWMNEVLPQTDITNANSWMNELSGVGGAPIPSSAMQKLVDAGVPWEIASKMSVSGLKSLLGMAQSNGGSGGNNPWASLLATGLGVYGSNKQTDSLNNLSRQFAEYGAPSRARYESTYQPGFTMANDPGFTDALNLTGKASAHAQSVGGNPTGYANAQTQINKDIFSQFAYPALQDYRKTNATTGGIASFNQAAPAAATAAVGSQGNMYNAIGAGINDVFNPKPTLAESMAQYQRLQSAFK